MHLEEFEQARPGDVIGFNVKNVSVRDIQRGYVASDPKNDPAGEIEVFIAHIIIMNYPTQIYNGYTPVVNFHTGHVACKFKILATIDQKTGKVIERDPESIKKGDSAIVEMRPIKPMTLETFKTYPPLGRICVRDNRETVAVGIVK